MLKREIVNGASTYLFLFWRLRVVYFDALNIERAAESCCIFGVRVFYVC